MQFTLSHAGQTYNNFTPQELVAAGVPEAEIEAATTSSFVTWATARIDEVCDRLFTRSPSRAERYAQKYAEALAYRAADYPASVAATAYPFLVAEAAARGLTKREQADLVIATAEGFTAIGAMAEARRSALAARIGAAVGAEAKRDEAEAAVAEFNQALIALTQEEA